MADLPARAVPPLRAVEPAPGLSCRSGGCRCTASWSNATAIHPAMRPCR